MLSGVIYRKPLGPVKGEIFDLKNTINTMVDRSIRSLPK